MSNQVSFGSAQATNVVSSLQPGGCLAYHPAGGALRSLSSPSSPSLRRLIEEKASFTYEQKARALRSFLQLLESVHSAGVVHRGVRPEVIHLAEDGEVFLGGWESATLFQKELPTPTQYSAPELVRKVADQIDARSDLFSVGVVWYEWLTGQVPFLFESPLKFLKEAANGATPPKQRASDCPESLSAFCLSLLAVEREKRPFSVLAALGYLENHFAESAPENSREAPKSAPSKTNEPKKGEDAVGREIGSYRVTGVLGRGGMGVVYKAEHPKIGKKVAVKLLNARFSTQKETVMRFFREARAVNDIHHENVIDVLDFGELPSGECFIIMEFLEGVPLSSLLKQEKRLPMARVGHILLQVCSALEAAHQKGIVHRDLKPDNIFLITRSAKPDFVKLLDFGIAKLLYDDDVPIETNTGAMIGTPMYMSPEQALGEKIDHQSDIYSFGVMLYQMVVGAPPFYDQNPITMAMFHITKEAKPAKELNPQISDELNEVIMRCLSKERSARFRTMSDVARALARACHIEPAPYLALLPGAAPESAATPSPDIISYQETKAPEAPRPPTAETNPPRPSLEATNPRSAQGPAVKETAPVAFQETLNASTGELVSAPKEKPRALPIGLLLGAFALVGAVAALFGLGLLHLGPPPTQTLLTVSKTPETTPAASLPAPNGLAASAPATTPSSQPTPQSQPASTTPKITKSPKPKDQPQKTPTTTEPQPPPEKKPTSEEDPDLSEFQSETMENLGKKPKKTN